MSDFPALIERRLAARESERRSAAHALDAEMHQLRLIFTAFDQWADACHRSVVRPRLETLRQHLPGASIEHIRTARGFHSRCTLARSERVPAQVTLQVGIDLETQRAMIVISYSLEIIPMLMECERRDELEMRLEARDADAVAPWIERKLLLFLDTYLSIERNPHYRRDTFSIDPVCGMRVSSAFTGEQTTKDGHSYAFCSAHCRERFLESPERYLTEPFVPLA
jgi:YHS domain-containing protein